MISEETRAYYDLRKRNDVRESGREMKKAVTANDAVTAFV